MSKSKMPSTPAQENVTSFRSGFWGISCEGNKKYSQVVDRRFHITMAALDPTVKPTSPIVSVMVERAGSKYLLCSLKPDSILQVNLNLYFDKGEEVTFSLKGHGTVHLSGYHIYKDSDSPIKNIQSPMKATIMKSPDKAVSNSSSVKKGIEKRESLSKALFSNASAKKIKTSPKKSAGKKSSSEEEEDSDEESDEEEESDDDDDDLGLDDSEDSEEESASKLDKKRAWEESSEDDMDEDSSEDDVKIDLSAKKASKEIQEKKKSKKEVVSPTKSASKSSENLNSSMGQTPMPVKKTCGVETPADLTASKKKKKKKKKNKSMEDASDAPATPQSANANLSSVKYSKKLPGGIEFDDIREGNGPVAKKGRLVHVYYTGKLDDNTVFDSTKPGSKPFSFRLGTGQVIKGWDFGVEGMKVGGKRKLKIPPHMGYKQQRMGDIPPNSTLHFVVELRAVS